MKKLYPSSSIHSFIYIYLVIFSTKTICLRIYNLVVFWLDIYLECFLFLLFGHCIKILLVLLTFSQRMKIYSDLTYQCIKNCFFFSLSTSMYLVVSFISNYLSIRLTIYFSIYRARDCISCPTSCRVLLSNKNVIVVVFEVFVYIWTVLRAIEASFNCAELLSKFGRLNNTFLSINKMIFIWIFI